MYEKVYKTKVNVLKERMNLQNQNKFIKTKNEKMYKTKLNVLKQSMK
jgi:hypothetical protein